MNSFYNKTENIGKHSEKPLVEKYSENHISRLLLAYLFCYKQLQFLITNIVLCSEIPFLRGKIYTENGIG